MAEHTPRRLSLLAVASALLLLAGCADRAIYAERTGVNFKISVNQDAQTPIEVNLGLQRSLVASVPPLATDSSTKKAASEAGSLVSGFDYSSGDALKARQIPGPDGKPVDAPAIDIDVQIRTSFASGDAANLLSYPGEFTSQDGKITAGEISPKGAEQAARAVEVVATAAGAPDTVVSVSLDRKLAAQTAVACLSNPQLDEVAKAMAKLPGYEDFADYVGSPTTIKDELRAAILAANNHGMDVIMAALTQQPCT